ncbi:MAG: hypothetical protein QOI73_630 [Solirubrobacteraceae bacterium]|nr:hypothetical protein [Solirubrobacteraceae bacterium]
MFGPSKTPVTERLRRAAELVRAFALLEDEGDRQPVGDHPAPPLTRTEVALEPIAVALVPHPHSARLVRGPRRRRPGTIDPRPPLCLTPVRPQPAGPMRRDLAAPRRLQSHRTGPHHS